MTQTDVHHADAGVRGAARAGSRTSRGCREFDELPANAQAYVHRLEELSGAPVSAIGVGPGRDETITRDV